MGTSSIPGGKSRSNSAGMVEGYPTRNMEAEPAGRQHPDCISRTSTKRTETKRDQTKRTLTRSMGKRETEPGQSEARSAGNGEQTGRAPLMANKTWPQQQVTIALRAAAKGNEGFFNRERRRLLIHAAKTALAAALCWWIALRFGLHDGYWGSISAIIVLQSNVGATVTASRDRMLGTLIGAVL